MNNNQMADVIAEILAVDTEEGTINQITTSENKISFEINGEKFEMTLSKIAK